MKPELIVELVYTFTALIVSVAGAYVVYIRNKGASPMYVRMVVCMLGCRFLQGFIEFLLLRSDVVMDGLSITGVGQLAQMFFLICANYGAIDSLVDEGSREYLKYRLIAAIVPVSILIYYLLNMGEIGKNAFDRCTILFGLVIMLIALYYHIKHLIIKDIEGGIVRSIRLYNLIGVINCVAMFVEWFTGPGTLTWYISMFLYILVTLTILPALEHGVRKWRTYRPVK